MILERQNVLLEAILDALKNQQPIVHVAPVSRLENDLENDFPGFSKPVATPSKMELAKKWLLEHPEDRELTGRDLKDLRQPEGVVISHKTWNDAKKELNP